MNVLIFDKNNKQQNYQYVARRLDNNEIVIGYLVIEKPWYSPVEQWIYHMYYNDYSSGGLCGGSSDLGLKSVKIIPETIKVYNQVSEIERNQEINMPTKLVKKFNLNLNDDDIIAIINPNDEIPYHLWD